jgi:hypothetical protein
VAFCRSRYHGASCDIKDPPSTLPSWQVWAKTLSETKVAVLVANYDNASTLSTSLTQSELGLLSSAKIATARDIWAHSDVAAGDALSFELGARSSAFRVLNIEA